MTYNHNLFSTSLRRYYPVQVMRVRIQRIQSQQLAPLEINYFESRLPTCDNRDYYYYYYYWLGQGPVYETEFSKKTKF